ncbi:MAG TPA: CPBP family glutamic-type intramembrane protease [Nitrospira sp.]|nr:CPBP family glutamic-type intramembrane protease [Nitrospira sp.]
MSEERVPVVQPQACLQAAEPAGSSEATEPFRSKLSIAVSVMSAMILVAAMGAILWFSATLPKLDRFEEPDRALDLMVSRTMEAQDGLRQSPAWQQWVAEWATGSNERERAQAIGWYQELIRTMGAPASKLRLAILQAESGQTQDALAEARRWQDLRAPMPFFGQLIEAAYGTRLLDLDREVEMQAELAEVLPSGWFYNHLASRLAQRAGDQPLLATVEGQIEVRGEQLQRRSRFLIVAELVCMIVGSVMLLGIVRLRGQRTDILRLHLPGVPPPWPGGVGTAVLLRGGALGAILTVVFLSFPPMEHTSLRALAIPLANLPLLALAYTHLLKPSGLDFRNGFGLQIECTQLGRLIGIVLAVVAAGLWGEWVMGRAAEVLNLTNHWTEWFDPGLVWASGSALTVSLLEYVILAPIFEELAFRGLLYAMLRRRVQFLPAAFISAGLFALAHGYGLIGCVSVLWSGFLWAWIYEKTGSLIPGMIAHALNNLLVCLTVMALLR